MSSVSVVTPLQQLLTQRVHPYLGSVLEQLMDPISGGFAQGRQLIAELMEGVCQELRVGGTNEQLKQVCTEVTPPPAESGSADSC